MASPRGLTKVRRQASEDVARMFGRTASACQRCNCGCALPVCRVSHLNQTPMGSKRKKKRKSTHQWRSVTEHHLVHTIRTQDESIQKKKRAICLAHTRTSQSKPCVCCAQTLPPERSEARGCEPQWHFASHPAQVVFFSGERRRQLCGKKMQALSNSSVAVLVELRSSHCLPEAHHVDPNVSTPIKSARCFTILPTPRHASPSSGIWEVCLHSIK